MCKKRGEVGSNNGLNGVPKHTSPERKALSQTLYCQANKWPKRSKRIDGLLRLWMFSYPCFSLIVVLFPMFEALLKSPSR